MFIKNVESIIYITVLSGLLAVSAFYLLFLQIEVSFVLKTHYPFIVFGILFMIYIALATAEFTKIVPERLISAVGPKTLRWAIITVFIINFFVTREAFRTIINELLPNCAMYLFPFQLSVILTLPIFFASLMHCSHRQTIELAKKYSWLR